MKKAAIKNTFVAAFFEFTFFFWYDRIRAMKKDKLKRAILTVETVRSNIT